MIVLYNLDDNEMLKPNVLVTPFFQMKVFEWQQYRLGLTPLTGPPAVWRGEE